MLNVSQIIEWISVIIIFIGSIISVISAYGMLRFPDVYTRAHAIAKSATLAVLSCLIGAFIYIWVKDNYVSIRLILGILFVFITSPVSTHLVIRAAYRSGVPLAEGSGEDELKPILFGEDKSTKNVQKGE